MEAFASGAALLARLDEMLPDTRPDVLLIDLAMPEEDGFTVLARVRAMEAERDPGGSSIPAIAVTAFTQIDRQRLHAAGFQDSVGKPVDAGSARRRHPRPRRRTPGRLGTALAGRSPVRLTRRARARPAPC